MSTATVNRPAQAKPSNSTARKTKSNSEKPKRRRHRSVFTNHQRNQLEYQFTLEKYIGKSERRRLAAEIGLTDEQVKTNSPMTRLIYGCKYFTFYFLIQIKVWFQNRRMKERLEGSKPILKADSVASSPLGSELSCFSEDVKSP